MGKFSILTILLVILCWNRSFEQTYYNPSQIRDPAFNITIHKIKFTPHYTEVNLKYWNDATTPGKNPILIKSPNDFVLIDNSTSKEYVLKSKYISKAHYPLLPGESKYQSIYFEPISNPSNDFSIYQKESFQNSLRKGSKPFRIDKINIYDQSKSNEIQKFIEPISLVITPIIDIETNLNYAPFVYEFFKINPIRTQHGSIPPVLSASVMYDQICITGTGQCSSNTIKFYIYNNFSIVDSIFLAFVENNNSDCIKTVLPDALLELHKKVTKSYNGQQLTILKTPYIKSDKLWNLKRIGGGNNFDVAVKDDELYCPLATHPKNEFEFNLKTFCFLPGYNSVRTIILPDSLSELKLYLHYSDDIESFDPNLWEARSYSTGTKRFHLGTMEYPFTLNSVNLLNDYLMSIYLGNAWGDNHKEIKSDFNQELIKYFPGIENLFIPYYQQGRVPYAYLAAGYKFKTIQKPEFALNCFISALISSNKTLLSSYEIAFIHSSVFDELYSYYESKQLDYYAELFLLYHKINLDFIQSNFAKNTLTEFYNIMSPVASELYQAETMLGQYYSQVSKLSWQGIGMGLGALTTSGLTRFGYQVGGYINDNNLNNLEYQYKSQISTMGQGVPQDISGGQFQEMGSSINLLDELSNFILCESSEVNSLVFSNLHKYADDKPVLKSLLLNYIENDYNSFKAIYNQLDYIEKTIVKYELNGMVIPKDIANSF